jgi:hypothetical protein
MFEPATFGSSGKQTNHYTTKATNLGKYKSVPVLSTASWSYTREIEVVSRVVNEVGKQHSQSEYGNKEKDPLPQPYNSTVPKSYSPQLLTLLTEPSKI